MNSIQSAFTLVLVMICLTGAFSAVIQKRETTEDTTSKSVCHNRTPCAWAVYVPFTRKIEYYMKNTCQCAEGRQCLRMDDDISVSAYVYRCSEGRSSTTKNSNISHSGEIVNSTAS